MADVITAFKNPISVRVVGDLANEVGQRTSEDLGAAAVMKRDLGRYYAACRAALKRLRLDYWEAQTLVNVLMNTQIDAASVRFLWAEIDEQVRARPQEFPEGSHEHTIAVSLIERLKSCSPLDALAVLDAIEIYWIVRRAAAADPATLDASVDGMFACGLTQDLPVLADES